MLDIVSEVAPSYWPAVASAAPILPHDVPRPERAWHVRRNSMLVLQSSSIPQCIMSVASALVELSDRPRAINADPSPMAILLRLCLCVHLAAVLAQSVWH